MLPVLSVTITEVFALTANPQPKPAAVAPGAGASGEPCRAGEPAAGDPVLPFRPASAAAQDGPGGSFGQPGGAASAGGSSGGGSGGGAGRGLTPGLTVFFC